MVGWILILLIAIFIGIYLFYYKFWVNPGSKLITLFTTWGEHLDKNNILPEYPRPQFVRESYLNLNGVWKYALRTPNQEIGNYDGDIIVPFSIESPLSGVQKSLKPGLVLWYNKNLNLSNFTNNGKYILNFGAVDQDTEVFINKKFIGSHKGGYTSFSFDITKEILESPNLENIDLTIKVIDNWKENGAAYGKQSNPRGNIKYISTGGIWQTVWIESVPNNYIKNVKITPFYDEKKVFFEPEFITESNKNNIIGKYIITDKEGKTISGELKEKGVFANIENIYSWTPENPFLYNVTFIFDKDEVKSYFAMRKFSIGFDKNNIKRLFLNNKIYFHNGVLDQGYWSDGYYTPPSDEAIKYDILLMKKLGFNMLRKHIKIEPMRWYYYCDIYGMIVWQDMISGGSSQNPFLVLVFPVLHISVPDNWYSLYGRKKIESRETYYRELKEMINQLYNVPSISTWVPFNEGWGQFDSLKVTNFIKNIDNTRYIDHASGFHDQNGGDFQSLHIYFGKLDFNNDKYNRVSALTEFGGYSYKIEGHCGSDHQFGYKFYKSKEEYNNALNDLYIKQLVPCIKKGFSAAVYTQLSDVEDEINGLVTYDRKVVKVDEEKIKRINQQIQYLDKE